MNSDLKWSDEDTKSVKKWIRNIFIVVILYIVATQGAVFVGAGERGVLMDLGKVRADTVLSPGFHPVIPLYNTVAKIDVQTQVFEAEATAASKDLQDAKTKVALNYHLNPDTTNILYRDIGTDYQARMIAPAIQEVVKASTAKFNAEELITRREAVKDTIQQGLFDRLNARGIVVEQISITNFAFSDQFSAAIESKVTAQQLALKADNDLQRIKIEAQQKVAQAEGDKQATILAAQGSATSIDLINKQLEKSPQYVNYLAVSKWNGQLPQVTSGAIPLIQIPTPSK